MFISRYSAYAHLESHNPLGPNWLRKGACAYVKQIRFAKYVGGLDIVPNISNE